jgi:integrase
MKESGLAYSTAKCYLSGLSYVINLHGWENPIETFLVKKLMSGFQRTRDLVDNRQPITLPLLKQIVRIIPSLAYSSYESLLFQSAFLLAFFALLRVSEVVAIKTNHIQIFDDKICVLIQNSKTDQLGKGNSVQITKNLDSMLLFDTLQEFYAFRQTIQADQLFVHYNENPITQYQFSCMLHKSLKFLELPSISYKSHSFRIGGATYLYLKGVPEI